MTLYELTEEMRGLLELLEEDLGEDEQEAVDTALQTVLVDITEKAEGYGQVIKQLEADAQAVKAEKMRLAKKQSALENRATRLRDAVKSAMLITGQKKIRTKLFSFSIGTREKAFLDCPIEEIPPDFWKVKDPEPDMKEIEKYLKEGHEVYFAHMEQVESLTIR